MLHEALPRYGRELLQASMDGDTEAIEARFVRFSAAYNGFVEGVLTMPSYEIVIDTTDLWKAFPGLREGFRLILRDEGRHITFGTQACYADREEPRVRASARGLRRVPRNLVGLVEYQKAALGSISWHCNRRSGTTATAAARWGSSPTPS